MRHPCTCLVFSFRCHLQIRGSETRLKLQQSKSSKGRAFERAINVGLSCAGGVEKSDVKASIFCGGETIS